MGPPRPPARRTKSVDRIERYHTLAAQAGPEQELDVDLIIPPAPKLANRIVELKLAGFDLPDGRTLFSDLNLNLEPGQRLGIVGRNGMGKTTLLKVMLGMQAPTRGEALMGTRTQVNYVDQGRILLDEDKTVWDEVGEGSEWVKLGEEQISIRGYLTRFLFTGDQVNSKIGLLSGGERSRVILAKILKRGGNVIVLDEPTNDLDLATLRVLEEALLGFGGVVVAVSHDRYFLNRVCTSSWPSRATGICTTTWATTMITRPSAPPTPPRPPAGRPKPPAKPVRHARPLPPPPDASLASRKPRNWKPSRHASSPPRKTSRGWKRCSPRPISTRSTATVGRNCRPSWKPPKRKSRGFTRVGMNWKRSGRLLPRNGKHPD